MRRFRLEAVGVTPLIMDADDIEGRDYFDEWRKKNKGQTKAGDERRPEWFWKLKLHYANGKVVIPVEMFNAALACAATKFSLKGNKSYREDVAAAVSPESDFDLKAGPKGVIVKKDDIDKIDGSFTEHVQAVAKLGFRLFVKRACPPGQQTRHIRIRPKFDEWCFAGVLRVTNDALPVELLEQILNKMCFGNWRPNSKKPGPYGQIEAAIKLCK